MKLFKSSFWLHSIFYTFLQRFSLFCFGTISFMVLVRGFDANETYAVWALYLALLTIFETVKQGLLRNPTIKFLHVPEYADKRNEVQSSSLSINILFSVITIVLLFAFGGLIAQLLKSPELQPLLWWSFLMVILLIPFNHCEILLQAQYQFSKIFWAHFVRQGIFFGGVVVIYVFFRAHFTLLNMMALQIVALLTGVIIMFIAASPHLLKRFHYDMHIIKRLFHFGKYIFGTNLFYNISRSFDHFITANTLSPIEGKHYVSYYNTVARINNMLDVPSLAAADVLFPKNVETLETDGLGKVKFYFEKMIGTIMALVVPLSVVIFIFPKLIIYILAGPDYYGAIPILQLTILLSLVRPLSYQFGSTLDAIGKPHINFWANCFFMLSNLVLTYVFLNKFGGMGAAYAMMINYVLSFFIMIVILKKHLHVELKKIFQYTLDSYSDFFKMTRKMLAGTNGS